MENATLLVGPHDRLAALCQIKAGQGGIEAQDWAEMLFRMYSRWADKRDYRIEVLAASRGAEAGYSNIEFLMRGRSAYGWLRSEHGVHRLARVSPHGNAGKRHTSFAAVDVLPYYGENPAERPCIADTDIRVDTYRASGPGGQHRNVRDTAVRVTHISTGIVARCHKERSQYLNKVQAINMLASKLLAKEQERQESALQAIRGGQPSVGFGSQCRSYSFVPAWLVKDHRTGHETSRLDAVLNGELDSFMTAWLQQHHASAGSSQGPADGRVSALNCANAGNGTHTGQKWSVLR